MTPFVMYLWFLMFVGFVLCVKLLVNAVTYLALQRKFHKLARSPVRRVFELAWARNTGLVLFVLVTYAVYVTVMVTRDVQEADALDWFNFVWVYALVVAGAIGAGGFLLFRRERAEAAAARVRARKVHQEREVSVDDVL